MLGVRACACVCISAHALARSCALVHACYVCVRGLPTMLQMAGRKYGSPRACARLACMSQAPTRQQTFVVNERSAVVKKGVHAQKGGARRCVTDHELPEIVTEL